MKSCCYAFVFVVLFAMLALRAEDAPEVLPPAASGPDVPAKMTLKDGQPHPKFNAMHAGFVKAAQAGKIQLVFIGDSITEGWMRNPDIWKKSFGEYQPANFGIGWDRTSGVLWRMTNGELDGKPKGMVLLIGTNNIQGDGVEGTARGITKIISTVREQAPATKILLLGILPRGKLPDDHHNPYREKIRQINTKLASLDDAKHIFFLDIGDKFLNADGTLMTEAMTPDFLHLTPKGYQIWADAIEQPLKKMLSSN